MLCECSGCAMCEVEEQEQREQVQEEPNYSLHEEVSIGLAGCMNAVAAPLGGLVGVKADRDELLLLLIIILPLDELFMFIKLDDEDEVLLDWPVRCWFSDNMPPARKVPALPPPTVPAAGSPAPRLSRSLLRFDRKPPTVELEPVPELGPPPAALLPP